MQYLYNKEWGACKSDFFQATNGVKQGSIISPILFTVYVDELIARLQASGLGCNIGRSYIGVEETGLVVTIFTQSHFFTKICQLDIFLGRDRVI